MRSHNVRHISIIRLSSWSIYFRSLLEIKISAGGEIIEINYFNTETFEDINENLYFENGKINGDRREFDLIAHIPKELHLHILNEINSFYTDKDFMEIVKSVWGK